MPNTNKGLKTIKRYQNRKLYDTQDSCYVTLEDIRDMIKEGWDVKIVDNASKKDLTTITLAQIILEEEKKDQGMLPLNMFKQIIHSGGEVLREIMHKSIESGFDEIQKVKSFVDKQIKPTVEGVQSLPTVTHEIKELKSKIENLEKELKNQGAKKLKK